MSDGETVALTYGQLAERLDIEVPSAKVRARRAGWRREPGNDGKTRVFVPVHVLAAEMQSEVAPAPPAAPVSAPDPAALLAQQASAALLAQLRADQAGELTRLAEAHKLALGALRDAHAAEIARLEAAQQRDREAHAAEIERLRADHAAEIERVMRRRGRVGRFLRKIRGRLAGGKPS